MSDIFTISNVLIILFMLSTIYFIFMLIYFVHLKRTNYLVKLKHSLKSFRQGIIYNYSSVVMIISVSIVGYKAFTRFVVPSLKMSNYQDILNYRAAVKVTIEYIVGRIVYCLAVCQSISFILYSISEIKHLSENEEETSIQKFLKVYVTYGIVSLLIVLYVITKFPILKGIEIVICPIVIIITFILGMADLLNKYTWDKLSRINRILNVFKDKEYRKDTKEVLAYNLRAISEGSRLFF